MRTKARITFTDFDTSSEIGGIDGSTYIVVNIQFTIDAGSGVRPANASIGISTRQGRRSYELVEPAWAYQPPMSEAILDYVRAAERQFRSAHPGHDSGALNRAVELELDLSALPW